jgi:hypothetical protein
VWWPIEVLALLLASTVVFDVVHYALHRFMESPVPLLRAIGGLHATHHAFLDRELRVHEQYLRANIRRHVIPEYATHITVSLVLLRFFPATVMLPVMAIQTTVFLLILRCRGKDINHRGWEVLPAYQPSWFCLPAYHALHHVHPDAYMSSWIKLFDHVAGTGLSLTGRRVVLTGAADGFGAQLAHRLEKGGVAGIERFELGRDFDGHDVSKLEAALADADILVLCHGSGDDTVPQACCDTSVRLIELFRETTRERRFPVEVWALQPPARQTAGPEDARLHKQRAFARHARSYWDDGRIIYRQIVAPASGLDPGSSRRAAAIASFWLRRGLNWVPATFHPRVLVDFLRFRYFVRPSPPDAAA